MIDRRLFEAFKFFRPRNGQIGRRATVGVALARAEIAAKEKGIAFQWQDDPDGMPEDGKCSCGCGAEIQACEGCLAYSGRYEHLSSLWGIWDADPDYRRIVMAELALEALDELERREALRLGPEYSI